MNYTKEKEFALKVIHGAGKELLKLFNQTKKLTFNKKSKHEIVTPADTAANKIILSGIKKNFPEHGILSEETGYEQKNSDYLWTIDPLDGTTNFAMGSPLWGVCLGLFYREDLVLGLINLPYMQELYWAVKDQGTYLNHLLTKLKASKEIKVARTKKLSNAIITYCYGYSDQSIIQGHKMSLVLREEAIDARQLGSAAVETAWLAHGRTQGFLVPKANLWDVAPGVLIIREAGGKVTDFKGKDWQIKSNDLLASNGLIHQELLKVIDKVK